jgi:hypothetical protein
MSRQFAIVLTFVAIALLPVAAQDKPQPQPQTPAPTPAPSSAPRQTPLRVQLTLTRFQGEKKVSSVPYILGVLTNAQKTSLRMGVQVPVLTTFVGNSGSSLPTIPQSSYSYKDVGTNIDCQAQDVGNGLYNLVITIDDSTFQLDRAASTDEKKLARDVPAFRSFRASFAMMLRDGQTMQYASATDPISGEVVKVDVMLSLAK